jgi:hypothetical protein
LQGIELENTSHKNRRIIPMKDRFFLRHGLVMLLAFWVLILAFSAGGWASTKEDGMNRVRELRLDSVEILSTAIVAAQADLPEYCRVTGYVRPAIHFEVRLPTATWNEKFYMAGCGGFCGKVEADRPGFTNAPNYGLKRNYAVAVTDSGHWGFPFFDGKWAYYNKQGEIDWAYRAIHEVVQASKKIIEAYHGKAPKFSYFAGCSNGGRQAVMEALKFPEDFNGVISGAPSLYQTGLAGILFSWVVQANRDPNGKPIVDHTRIGLLSEAVYKACDEKDGLKDGMIRDPRRVQFDPESLLCSDGKTSDCLTQEQVAALKKLYSGPKNSQGKQLYPGGLPLGSEPFWPLWVTGSPKGPGLIGMLNVNYLKYMAFDTDPDGTYNPYKFDFDNDPPKLECMAAIYNATDPDLSKFQQKGGKMIMYHGWADSIVTPLFTIEYYDSVVQKMGGLEKTQEFFRLFMIPGMDHCSILPGKGPDQIDVLTALENWVEKGVAPNEMIASQYEKGGKVVRTRPVYPYPQEAKYKDAGDVNQASSFKSVVP